MSRDTCKMPNCDHAPGSQDDRSDYRTNRFCSVKHDVKYDHLKADAEDARRAAQEPPQEERP